MGQRMLRVSKLVKREISELLHTRYRSESVYITISDVEVSSDLRNARVYFSVVGDSERAASAGRFLKAESRELRRMLGKRIVLKYLPNLSFVYDKALERGVHLNALIDEFGFDEESV
ncbi:MAG: Ribosome-binding factor A [Candidatus Moanabacter tarae]|uniref:Ribosome-binding factor A n=1 Tax=Candidatus Moanibacter tarae TaxID=2200854 RepID=A0A2Z4ALS6_9BACT|nr:MAG: Ribosome-binding factor A [Candidatus Moanabacter tarae]